MLLYYSSIYCLCSSVEFHKNRTFFSTGHATSNFADKSAGILRQYYKNDDEAGDVRYGEKGDSYDYEDIDVDDSVKKYDKHDNDDIYDDKTEKSDGNHENDDNGQDHGNNDDADNGDDHYDKNYVDYVDEDHDGNDDDDDIKGDVDVKNSSNSEVDRNYDQDDMKDRYDDYGDDNDDNY